MVSVQSSISLSSFPPPQKPHSDASTSTSANNIMPAKIKSPLKRKARRSTETLDHEEIMEQQVEDGEIPKFFMANSKIPVEIYRHIFKFLNPIDAVCLSLVNKHMHYISPVLNPDKSVQPSKHSKPIDLNTGAPDSAHPVIQASGCHHCVPVLYYPAHCELSFHLRSLMPPELIYCVGCGKYTRPASFYIDPRFVFHSVVEAQSGECGKCGTSYWRRFERGRRMIDMRRPGEKQERLRKWYNDSMQSIAS